MLTTKQIKLQVLQTSLMNHKRRVYTMTSMSRSDLRILMYPLRLVYSVNYATKIWLKWLGSSKIRRAFVDKTEPG